MKHLQIRLLWLQDEVAARRLELRHIASCNNRADIATKHLSAVQHHRLCATIGLSGQADWPAEEEYVIDNTPAQPSAIELNVISASPSCLPLPSELARASSFLLDHIKPVNLIPQVMSMPSWSAAIWEAIRYSPEVKDFAKLCKELLHYEQAGVRQEDQEVNRRRRQAKKYWNGVLEQQLCPACLEQMPGWEDSIEDRCDLIEAWRDGRHFHHHK